MTPGAEAKRHVLIIEDTPTQAELLKVLVRRLGYETCHAETAAAGLAEAIARQPHAILLDIGLPDFSGLELLRRLRAESVDAAVIVITAQGSVNLAVEAMRAGAADFVVKPYAAARLAVALQNSLGHPQPVAAQRAAHARPGRDRSFGFIGASPVMQVVYRTIEAVATSRASVFITGESGTGKELAAEAVHQASPRRAKPFVALNCGAIPRDLLESEVFGHVKGAFTGATENRMGAAKLADGGTLFLDEIGEMPLDMQVKLLRFVQTGTFHPVGATRSEHVDVRFVCATNRDPLAEIAAGRFREDLYYRLHVVPLDLPPLRERGSDLLLIASHFLARFSGEEDKRFDGFAPDAEQLLLAYRWPGNVRQLENVLRSVVVLNDGGLVTRLMLHRLLRPADCDLAASGTTPAPGSVARSAPLADPPLHILPEMAPVAPSPVAQETTSTAPIPAGSRLARPDDEFLPLWAMEKRLVLAALERAGNDVPRAASLLQINPSTVYRKLHAWRAESERG